MGVFKKVLGLDYKTPTVVTPDPTPTTVTSQETSLDTGSDAQKKKKRQGMASTIISKDRSTLASESTGRKTLG